MHSTSLFASTYGCGAYGAGTYENGTCTSTGGGGTTTGGGSGTLSNTGFDLLLVLTIAVTLIFIALLVRLWKRPKKKLSTPPDDRPSGPGRDTRAS